MNDATLRANALLWFARIHPHGGSWTPPQCSVASRCSFHFEPGIDTDQQGVKRKISLGRQCGTSQWVAIDQGRPCHRMATGSCQRPRVHGSPRGFRLSVHVPALPGAQHPESVNSNAELRASIAFHRLTRPSQRLPTRDAAWPTSSWAARFGPFASASSSADGRTWWPVYATFVVGPWTWW